MDNQSIDQNEPESLVTYDRYRKALSTIYTDIATIYLPDAMDQIFAKESKISDPVVFTNAMDFMIDHFLFDTMTDQGIPIYKDYFDSFPPKDTIREQMKASIESSFASVFEYISHDKANKELTLIDIFTEKKYLVLDRRFEIVREIEGSLFLVTRLLKIPEIDFYMHSGGIKHPILGLDTKTILKQYWKANKRQDFENHPKRRLDFLLTL